MGKKNKNKQSVSVIQSLKAMATTVKADAPTVMLKPTDGPLAKTMLSKLNPFGAAATAARATKKQLDKMQKQMASNGHKSPKPRRSRLPALVAVLALLLGGASYWVYTKVSLPNVHVAQYLDYKKWLDMVSGNTNPHESKRKPQTTRNVERETAKFERVEKRQPVIIASPGAASPQIAKEIAKQPVVAKKVVRRATKPTIASKKFQKLPHSAKEQIWQKKLATLRKQSAQKNAKLTKGKRR